MDSYDSYDRAHKKLHELGFDCLQVTTIPGHKPALETRLYTRRSDGHAAILTAQDRGEGFTGWQIYLAVAPNTIDVEATFRELDRLAAAPSASPEKKVALHPATPSEFELAFLRYLDVPSSYAPTAVPRVSFDFVMALVNRGLIVLGPSYPDLDAELTDAGRALVRESSK